MALGSNKYRALILALIPAVGFPAYATADSIVRADKNDVTMLLAAATGMNSAYWASYIGETRGRVYIEYTTAIHAGSLFSDKPKHVVYWLPSSELTQEQLDKFKEFKKKYEPGG